MASQFVYWLTDKRSSEYSEITDALAAMYGVRFFSRCDDMIRQLASIRPDTIIISTRPSVEDTLSDINTICKNPEAKGLKMVLSLERDDPRSVHLAASLCFREIIPISTPAVTWINRFKFSTAAKPQRIKYTLPEQGDIMQAVMRAPSRINWVDKDRLCIETSAFFEPGNKFNLLGPFPVFLGYRELPLTVMERQSKRLRYRHSSSIICKINIDEVQDFKTDKLKTIARGQASTAPMNIYAIAKTQSGRLQIINAFGQHNVLFATKLTTAEKELEYFEPDALIMEESFVTNKDIQPLIGKRLTCIIRDPNTAAISVPLLPQVKLFNSVSEIHKYLQIKVPLKQRARDAKWYIPEVSDFSRCSVQFSGSVERISKDLLIVNSPIRVRNFSLLEVATQVAEAQNLSEYLKICEPQPGPDGQHSASYIGMKLCSSNDIFGTSSHAATLVDISSVAKARPSTSSGNKLVVQARTESQIAPGHEFYAKQEIRDVKIAYQKRSSARIILDSLDVKYVLQGIFLALVGIGLVYALSTAIKSPNTNLKGFAGWISGTAQSTGK